MTTLGLFYCQFAKGAAHFGVEFRALALKAVFMAGGFARSGTRRTNRWINI